MCILRDQGLEKKDRKLWLIVMKIGTNRAAVLKAVVEFMPHNREIMGWIPTGCLAFFLLSSRRCSITVFLYKTKMNAQLSCAAWGETSLISTSNQRA